MPALGSIPATSVVEAVLTPASSVQVREVGNLNQIRAGRVLTAADFTNMGLAAPLGLWNLTDLLDASGNARALSNRNAVAFGSGILGAATEAAIFNGTDKALYIPSAVWQQITTGSFGCWFRTAKRSTHQALISKFPAVSGTYSYELYISGNNNVGVQCSVDGTVLVAPTSVSDPGDDRWHFAVATFDGTRLSLYFDGVLESSAALSGPLMASAAPLNIGGRLGDAATATVVPHFGRIDEVFLTPDVLSEDQIRNLYCARIAHTLGVIPSRASLNVRRRKRGGPILSADFPSAPIRLHNFTGGALTDAGSGNVALVAVGGGTISDVAGVDGTALGAKHFAGAHTGLGATDAGLPAALTSRSYGCWFKNNLHANDSYPLIGWGTTGTADTRLVLNNMGTTISSFSGADQAVIPTTYVQDGGWHHIVVVEENAPLDGVKRKVYVDGGLIGGSTVLNTLTLVGANGFRLGVNPNGTGVAFPGTIDGPFVIGVTLTPEQVRTLYNLGSQALAPSPKSEGDHIEAMSMTDLLVVFDTLEGDDQIDLKVNA